MSKPNDEQLQMIFEDMVSSNAGWKALEHATSGQVGTITPIDGHEAAIVGAVHALQTESDWVLPQYRNPWGSENTVRKCLMLSCSTALAIR